MQAGRELDALVAERVMGWKYLPAGAHPNLHSEAWTNDDGASAVFDPPPYSTSIQDAWQVVEKMRGRQRIAQENNTSDQAWVKFVWALPMAQHGVHYMLFNLTPEAICLAALNSVGVEVA